VVGPKVPPRSDAVQLAALLDSPEIGQLVSELAATRWTGRPGYPIRTMVGMGLAKSVYTLPTWTRTVALLSKHAALRTALVVLTLVTCRVFTPATASTRSCGRSSRCLTPALTG